jgi:hypothetical protein
MIQEAMSAKGKDFSGRKLNEETLKGDTHVVWRNKVYTTGNRHHEQVELYVGKKFLRTASMKHIRLITLGV